MQWIDENALATWAKRIDARSLLPDLIADLIRATTSSSTTFRFPGGDTAQLRGWDGNLETTEAISYVPLGKSKWEFGSGAGAAKASADYSKRSKNTSAEEMAENTLVLVNLEKWDTPRVQLSSWVDDRKKENKWRDVRYLDAVDLVHWLDQNPAVAALYARSVLHNAPKEGALSTDEFWDMYSARFKPRLKEHVVISDRQAAADALLARLAGPPQLIMLGADSSQEVVAFAVAAIRLAKPEIRRALEVRTLIVETDTAARFLSEHTNLVFIATKTGESMAGVLAMKGATLSAATGVQARKYEVLQRPSASSMADGFVAMGLDRQSGYELAHRCGRSLIILQRIISNGPYADPPWVKDAPNLKPALLAGGWSANVGLDKEILKDLSGLPDYDSLESRLFPTLALFDPPIDRVDEYWQVRAPVDAFIFYGHLISEVDLQRLKDAALKVFGHIVPPPTRDQKFSISYVSAADYSKWLRDGLALTLLIIATMHKIGGLRTSKTTPQHYVDEILSSLPEWGKKHEILVALGDQTTLLAEAAPNPFLRALESMLEGDRNEVVRFFSREGDDIFGPSSPHHQLLWALEALAWNPSFLNRTASVLAQLAELDPDPESRHVNRPINSLRSILLSWSPNTHANFQQRIACVDFLLGRHPIAGWQLLVKLLPRHHDSSSPSQKPLLRDVSPVVKGELTFGLVWDAEREIVNRAIQMAGDDEHRVIVLTKQFSAFQPSDRVSVIKFIDSYLSRHITDEGSVVWHALHEENARHEYFADADWAMQDQERALIAQVLDRHRPTDPYLTDKQLFDDWLPYVGRHKNDDDLDLDSPRIEVLQKILVRDGPLGILKLSQKVKVPDLIGPLIGQLSISEIQLLDLLVAAIAPPAPGSIDVYVSAIGAREHPSTWPSLFSKHVLPLAQSPALVARLFRGWPLTAQTWDFIASLGHDVNDEYWRQIHMLPNEGEPVLLLHAIAEFRRVSRSMDVLSLAHRRLRELPTTLLLALLQESVKQINNAEVRNTTMLSYHLDAVFRELDSRSDVNPEEIARLEYSYFPLLEDGKRSLSIHEFLAKEPYFFVELLSHAFRKESSSGERALTDLDRSLAENSYRVLSSFKTIPGSENGRIDAGRLETWVTGARESAVRMDLTTIADQYIGHILAHAPIDSAEGSWPPSPVCMVLERIDSTEIERGIEIECFNKRGVYGKAMHEGGTQERSLAAKYRSWATQTVHFPRTSAMLLRISESWERHADDEDKRAEIGKMKR